MAATHGAEFDFTAHDRLGHARRHHRFSATPSIVPEHVLTVTRHTVIIGHAPRPRILRPRPARRPRRRKSAHGTVLHPAGPAAVARDAGARGALQRRTPRSITAHPPASARAFAAGGDTEAAG